MPQLREDLLLRLPVALGAAAMLRAGAPGEGLHALLRVPRDALLPRQGGALTRAGLPSRASSRPGRRDHKSVSDPLPPLSPPRPPHGGVRAQGCAGGAWGPRRVSAGRAGTLRISGPERLAQTQTRSGQGVPALLRRIGPRPRASSPGKAPVGIWTPHSAAQWRALGPPWASGRLGPPELPQRSPVAFLATAAYAHGGCGTSDLGPPGRGGPSGDRGEASNTPTWVLSPAPLRVSRTWPRMIPETSGCGPQVKTGCYGPPSKCPPKLPRLR